MLDKEYLDELYKKQFDALKMLDAYKEVMKAPTEDYGNDIANNLNHDKRALSLSHYKERYDSCEEAITLYFKHHNND